MTKYFPDNPKDAIGLIITLAPGATTSSISNYGTDEYIIGYSTANADIPNITTEELLRIFPRDEYPDGWVHALLFGKGLYQQLKDKFIVIGKLNN